MNANAKRLTCSSAVSKSFQVGTLLELKQRCDYLEGMVYNLLAHNQEVLMSTLVCRESHPIDFYQSNHQVSHIHNIEGFGFMPITFLPLLQEYLQAQNNHYNYRNNNNNSGFDGICTLRVSKEDVYSTKTPPSKKKKKKKYIYIYIK